jgi:hypothetical protein
LTPDIRVVLPVPPVLVVVAAVNVDTGEETDVALLGEDAAYAPPKLADATVGPVAAAPPTPVAAAEAPVGSGTHSFKHLLMEHA